MNRPRRIIGLTDVTLCLFAIIALIACDVGPVGLEPTGIADLESMPRDDCSLGFLIASSDYQSSNISAMDRQGNILSSSLVSSGQSPAGLVQAFSGDVVFPTEPQSGTEAILIDRYPQSVVTFLDLRDASIRAQLDVSTGFRANPHDALRLDDANLLLTRFDSNPNAGNEPHDAGGDVLLLDPVAPRILSRVDLSSAIADRSNGFLPHPERMLRIGTRVFVVVALYSPDYRKTGASYLVTIDAASLSVVDSVEIADLVGCAGIAAAPNRNEIAIACSGSWGTKDGADPEASGLVGYDITGLPIEQWKLLASSMDPAQAFGFSVAYAERNRVVAVALGRHAIAGRAAQRDRFVSYDVKTKTAHVVQINQNEPFTLGDVRCLSHCGRCALTNAHGRGSVLLYQGTNLGLELDTEIVIDDHLGLPPRWLGTF